MAMKKKTKHCRLEGEFCFDCNPEIFFRQNTAHWKVKDINPEEQRAKGYCPLTPKEVGVFLTSLGYPSKTPIYIASGEIYGGDSRMADLRSHFPILMDKVRHFVQLVIQSCNCHDLVRSRLPHFSWHLFLLFVPCKSGF